MIKSFRGPGVLLTASVLSILLVVASQHRIDFDAGVVAKPTVGIAMLIAWIIANLMMANTSSNDTGSPMGLQSCIAPCRPIALLQWRLGELVALVAVSIAFVPIGWLVVYPPGLAGVAVLEFLRVVVAAAAAVLVITVLSSFLPRAAALAASGAWLLLSTGAGSPTESDLERFVTAPLFPLSQVLAGADEPAHFSGSLQAIASVALFDLGLLLLLVAIDLRRRR